MFIGWEGVNWKEMEHQGQKEKGRHAVLHVFQQGRFLYMTQEQLNIIELVINEASASRSPLY